MPILPEPIQWNSIESFIRSKDSGNIPPSLRVILASDGILTTALESLFLSPVELEIIRQEEKPVDPKTAEFLQVEAGVPALVREVWLKAKGVKIVFASSVIPIDGLSPSLLRALKNDSTPLGLILYESGRPTIKDRMQAARLDDSAQKGGFGFGTAASLWTRRYRLSSGEKFSMFIQEIINEEPFRDKPGIKTEPFI
ncbi:MAG TPA: chorismate lyase [Nitrospiria bacterium]|nr:chorismate lyase [Nitrospiria bacterium]